MNYILTFFGGAICGALIMALVVVGDDNND